MCTESKKGLKLNSHDGMKHILRFLTCSKYNFIIVYLWENVSLFFQVLLFQIHF